MKIRTFLFLTILLAAAMQAAPPAAEAHFRVSRNHVLVSGTVVQTAPQAVWLSTPSGVVAVPTGLGRFEVAGLGVAPSALVVGTTATAFVPADQAGLVVPANHFLLPASSFDQFLVGDALLVTPPGVVTAPLAAAPTAVVVPPASFGGMLAAGPVVVPSTSTAALRAGDFSLALSETTPAVAVAPPLAFLPAVSPTTSLSLGVGDFRLGLTETQPLFGFMPSTSVFSLGLGDVAFLSSGFVPTSTFFLTSGDVSLALSSVSPVTTVFAPTVFAPTLVSTTFLPTTTTFLISDDDDFFLAPSSFFLASRPSKVNIHNNIHVHNHHLSLTGRQEAFVDFRDWTRHGHRGRWGYDLAPSLLLPNLEDGVKFAWHGDRDRFAGGGDRKDRGDRKERLAWSGDHRVGLAPQHSGGGRGDRVRFAPQRPQGGGGGGDRVRFAPQRPQGGGGGDRVRFAPQRPQGGGGGSGDRVRFAPQRPQGGGGPRIQFAPPRPQGGGGPRIQFAPQRQQGGEGPRIQFAPQRQQGGGGGPRVQFQPQRQQDGGGGGRMEQQRPERNGGGPREESRGRGRGR